MAEDQGTNGRLQQPNPAPAQTNEPVIALRDTLDVLQSVHSRIKAQTEQMRNTCSAIDSRRAEHTRMAWGGPWPALVVDRHGIIGEVSSGAIGLLGVDREQIIGKPLSTFINPDQRQLLTRPLAASRRDAVTYQLEVEIQTPAGKTIPVIATCKGLGADNPTGAVRIALTDISMRRRSEKALRDKAEQLAAANAVLAAQAEQLRQLSARLVLAEQNERRRIADLLHDHVQQLLVACKMSFDVLLTRNPQLADRGKVQLGLLQEAIEALRSLSVELRPPALQERGFCATLSWLAHWMDQKHNLAVVVHAAPEADRLSLEIQVALFQTVRELLFNVVKHSGVLEARVVALPDPKSGEIVITVEDDGVGMDVRRATTSEFGHLGLPSMRERLHALGVGFGIESWPSEGTRFTIRAKPDPATEERQALVLVPNVPVGPFVVPQSDTIRVLIADDHAMVRQGIGLLLQHAGRFEVVAEAANGKEAFEMAAQHLPDVILMDVNMPECNGIEATRRIKLALPQVRIIGLSMHANSELAESMRAAGADGYVNKAAPSEELLGAIRSQIPTAPGAHAEPQPQCQALASA